MEMRKNLTTGRARQVNAPARRLLSIPAPKVVWAAPASAVLMGVTLTFGEVTPAAAHVRTTTSAVASPAPKGDAALAGATLYVAAYNSARAAADAWKGNSSDGAILRKLAEQPQAYWIAEWSGNAQKAVGNIVGAAAQAGAVPVLVAYNIPDRDCGSHSAGGVKASEYRTWIRSFAKGIGNRPAVVILEPDAVAGASCLPAAGQAERFALLKDAVEVLKANTNTSVYVDAGHARWLPAEQVAQLL